ncbi:hypothetical protein ACH35V_08595 [Actinomadura sp. 1N219]|uniref:hypothetical protein n=1 Tax=Actinomadura sp. 1N219 TaxID=3375152 RepID=UPI0037AB7CDF
MKVVRRPALSVLFGVLAAAVLIIGPPLSASAAGPRIDLQVLVVTNGSASVTAVTQQLKAEGVPYKTVDLRAAGRPVIDEAFLSDTVDGTPRAKFQGVVLPNAAPFENDAEMAALAAYEKRFGIRQLDAHVRPSAAVGLNAPAYTGPMDGVTAQVTEAARADALRYLGGPVRFDDVEPGVGETTGFVATPLPDDPDAGKSFKPFVTANVKGTAGAVAGVYTHDGRSEMVLTFTSESEQWHFQTLGRGLVTWLTKGVHLGYDRNYFGVHVDDVFMPDARWSTEHNCTPTEDCEDGVETEDIRMEAGDVSFATQWQTQHGFVLDMAYNGAGSDEAALKNGVDPLTVAFVAVRDKFRWLNHTYSHPFLGCVQDNSTSPWQCRRNQSGQIVYVSAADIEREVSKNVQWASGRGIPVDASELVTGEHSGLRVTPQQPDDNPNLAPVLAKTGVKWTASDASREKAQRVIGSVRTVPRHPLNIFYNVGTAEEEVDQYNWIHTRRSDGGSGICEEDSSCIEPLDPDSGYESYIVPVETRTALTHVLANDPRPHYAHQSNLAEGRILYPVLERVLSQYWSSFAANTPIINAPMSALGDELRRQDAWRAAVGAGAMDRGDVTAYVQDGTVTVKAPAGLEAPVTAPEGTQDAGGAPFGQAYAGERSAYRAGDVTLTLPGA